MLPYRLPSCSTDVRKFAYYLTTPAIGQHSYRRIYSVRLSNEPRTTFEFDSTPRRSYHVPIDTRIFKVSTTNKILYTMTEKPDGTKNIGCRGCSRPENEKRRYLCTGQAKKTESECSVILCRASRSFMWLDKSQIGHT